MKAVNLTCDKQGIRRTDADIPNSVMSVGSVSPSAIQPTTTENLSGIELKQNVTVEKVNPPLGDFTSANSQFACQENVAAGILDAAAPSTLPGYGPEYIAEETEVVAAEINTATGTSEVVVSLDVSLGNSRTSESHCENKSEAVTLSNVADSGSDLEAQSQDNTVEIMMDSCERDTVPLSTSQTSLTDQTTFMSDLKKDRPVNLTPMMLTSGLTPGQTLAWMKREWKKARDRAKKRSKRADPLYRTKERAEALVRMRNRRLDPEYRERERARDRQRRKLARQKNLIQRQEERARDRMYKQRRRTSLMQDPQLVSGDMSSEYADGEDSHRNVNDIETSRDSSMLECTNDLDFQVVEVYNQMEVKVEHCVEAYS